MFYLLCTDSRYSNQGRWNGWGFPALRKISFHCHFKLFLTVQIVTNITSCSEVKHFKSSCGSERKKIIFYLNAQEHLSFNTATLGQVYLTINWSSLSPMLAASLISTPYFWHGTTRSILGSQKDSDHSLH